MMLLKYILFFVGGFYLGVLFVAMLTISGNDNDSNRRESG
jgi:hypothetical protein